MGAGEVLLVCCKGRLRHVTGLASKPLKFGFPSVRIISGHPCLALKRVLNNTLQEGKMAQQVKTHTGKTEFNTQHPRGRRTNPC